MKSRRRDGEESWKGKHSRGRVSFWSRGTPSVDTVPDYWIGWRHMALRPTRLLNDAELVEPMGLGENLLGLVVGCDGTLISWSRVTMTLQSI